MPQSAFEGRAAGGRLAGDEAAQVLAFTIPARLTDVAAVLEALEEKALVWDGRPPVNTSIVLRELLVNAVHHGAGDASARVVRGKVERLGAGHFRVRVEDDGEGFAWQALDLEIGEDPRRIPNRGLALVRSLSREMAFHGRGNVVTAEVQEGL